MRAPLAAGASAMRAEGGDGSDGGGAAGQGADAFDMPAAGARARPGEAPGRCAGLLHPWVKSRHALANSRALSQMNAAGFFMARPRRRKQAWLARAAAMTAARGAGP